MVYEMRINDWSSDVCASDLAALRADCFVSATPSKQRCRLEQSRRLSAPALKRKCSRTCILNPAARTIRGSCPPGETAAALRTRLGPPVRRPRSEEHTSELQSLMRISYAVFCLKKKKQTTLLNNR